MKTFPMLTTYVIRVRGERHASIQNKTGDEVKTAEHAEFYADQVRAKYAVNDPEGAASVTIAITTEPDHYLEGQAWVDFYDR